ncbi:MAG: hypothetical protein WA364_29865 [Candidatus Nitrosopolaris sp.]
MLTKSDAQQRLIVRSYVRGFGTNYQTRGGYDNVLIIATTAKSISSTFLDLFCLHLASNDVIF